ncbi:VRR-NUC domain-containing protein [Gemella sp. ND 6198]|uniref:VRR-NUC domain-containing protein n=1 Tax=Gemella sp. ND 6198 TaxID=2040624 RepID=UPI000E0B6022|nr:VRR-NUC domain-containing protein [Gemella sp. ND 6198]AXI27473.1 VRR-NUC domain-containing protein [Gemella sp. ND 6198]
MFRINVGSFKVGNRVISTGVPKGFPDLFGFRRSDGKAIFLEVKTPKGRLRKEQKTFKEALSKQNVVYGVVRNLEDARKIILRT